MTGRSHITENTKKQPASTPAQGMFQPRPFVVQRQTEEQLEQPDIKTALQRAKRYGHSLDRIKSIEPPVPAQIPQIVQAKLTIGQPGDRYEQEADRVAAQVVNSFHAPTAQRQEMPEEDELQMKPEIGAIQREAMPEEDEELQMKPEAGTIERQELPEEDEELQVQSIVQLQPNGSEMTAQPDLEASIQQARGSGQPLADSIKEPMEQAMGADFNGVRVHTGAQSDQLNRSIQARAFTTGQDVFFRQGEYNPGSRGGQELLAHELTHVVQQNGGAVQRSKQQATGQTLQASTSLKRDESNTVQRKILLNSPNGQFNVQELLTKIGITDESLLSNWFKTMIRPKLMRRVGYEQFKGYLNNNKEQYTFGAEINTADKEPSHCEVTTGVIKAINIHLMSLIVKGHSSIGTVKLLKRQGFPSYIKKAFDKNSVMEETGLESKDIHLRHFVMGSWFRALPDLVKKAQLTQPKDYNDLTERVRKLIQVLGPFSGSNAQGVKDLNTDIKTLANILHDFAPNLNAGEGPENSLIGFLSHAYSELAQQVLKDKTSIEKGDLPEFVEGTINALTLISNNARREWIEKVKPSDVFMGLVNNVSPDANALPPDILAQVMHDFAYQLGMDFMKRQSGMMSEISEVTTIAELQKMLAPIGENLYALIVSSQDNDVDYTVLSKLLHKIEVLADWGNKPKDDLMDVDAD